MTAPVEVWVLNGEAWHTPVENRTHGKSVRYLRADLTCGECALRGVVLPEKFRGDMMRYACPHTVYVWTPSHTAPACMAFVPREETHAP